jgi:hypothetical protein
MEFTNMPNIPQKRESCNAERQLGQLRTYLGRLENIARHGRLAEDPAEVKAAVWTFARPSAVLRRLAERERRLA